MRIHTMAYKQQDITAVLTLYRRPHTLREQLAAIKGQSVPPTRVLLWHNRVDGIVVPPDVCADPLVTVMDGGANFGVWARFAAALLANTEFVAVFDDDTIPGPRWFDNCLRTMGAVNGLLGTIGVVQRSDGLDTQYRVGWDGPNELVTRVDFVGHAWFARRAWLGLLWAHTTPNYAPDAFLRAGEDMGFSHALQQAGIQTYVPPHPVGQPDLWGSDPRKAWKYGTEPVAISATAGGFSLFRRAFAHYAAAGFRQLLHIVPPPADGSDAMHLEWVLHKLAAGEPFSLVRFADGEVAVMRGQAIHGIDGWTYDGGPRMRNDLLSLWALLGDNRGMLVGIPCPSCWAENPEPYFRDALRLRDGREQLTYCNLFVNHNWARWTGFLRATRLPFYYIGPGAAPTTELNVMDRFPVSPLLLNEWPAVADATLDAVRAWVKPRAKAGAVFMVSAGPPAKVFIAHLSAEHPGCTFIDAGSSLDLFLKGAANRPYARDSRSHDAQQGCSFVAGHAAVPHTPSSPTPEAVYAARRVT